MAFTVGASLLDACVLSILSEGDAYGYFLTQSIKSVLSLSESTLYPVLRRLEQGNYLLTYDKPFQGRNRRYYSITESGRAQLELFRRQWQEYKNNLDNLLLKGVKEND